MKSLHLLIFIAFAVFTSCHLPEEIASKKYTDDIYFSSKDAATEKEIKDQERERQRQEMAAEQERQRVQSQTNQQSSPSSNDDYYTPNSQRISVAGSHKNSNSSTNSTNNNYNQPFNYDDYYDNAYAARIRRFNNNIYNYGYYDDYYTNSYWYTGNPYNYGSSIYLGYNFWGPSYNNYAYNPGYNWYSGMGWGYNPYGNPYSYNPYYGYNPYGSYGGYNGYNPYGSNYGYNPYYNGYGGGYGGYGSYNQGFWNGYYNGFYNGYSSNNYFNSYDNNSYYYGPRGTTASNSRTTVQPTMAHRYMSVVEEETHKPFDETKGRLNNPFMVSETHEIVQPKTNNTNIYSTNHLEINNTAPNKSVSHDNNTIPIHTNSNYNAAPMNNAFDRVSEPVNQSSKYEKPEYNFNKQSYNSYESQTPSRVESAPRFEKPMEQNFNNNRMNDRPRFDEPHNSSPMQMSPSISAPRNNGSGTESRPRR